MEKVKVAVIGFGHLGKWHTEKAHNLENSELVAIVESFEPNHKAAKEKYPNVKIVNDIKEVIDDIDAAIIVTPTSTHFELCQYLMQNKKHVFCEKPICPTLTEALKLEDYIPEGKVVQVGHSERCHQIWEELRPKIHSVGTPAHIKITRVAAFKGRATDVDVVQDLMIHDLDLCKWLINEEVISVFASGNKIRTGKWDHVNAMIKFINGSSAIITSSRNHVKEIRSLEVSTDKGFHYVDLMNNEYSFATPDVFENGEYVQTSSYEKRDHLLMEQKEFYNSILENKEAMVDYYDGVRAVRLVQAVIESLESGDEIKL
jgi:predicted dehydrogenase